MADPRKRGAATLELALVVPLLITMTLFGMYFSELARAKLKLLEASRFTVFEMTSYVLDDYGNAQHGRAFDEAKGHTLGDSLQKFRDLDSVADRGNTGIIAGFSGFDAKLENQRVELNGTFSTVQGRNMPLPPRTLNGSASEVHQLFGFNQSGKLQADVSVRLDNRILPRDFMNDDRGFFQVNQWGGSSLQSVLLKSRFTMIASGWQLSDGADAVMEKDEGNGGRVAGLHRGHSTHGMWTQVNRMAHLGTRQAESDLVGLQAIDVASFVLPHPYSSTFVTAHNYGLPSPLDRRCNDGRGNSDPGHPYPSGMNNLDVFSEIDSPWRKCYDTMPFRDTAAYDESLSIRQYTNRGEHFMGCINAEADDPSHAGRSPFLAFDFNRRKVDCGGDGP